MSNNENGTSGIKSPQINVLIITTAWRYINGVEKSLFELLFKIKISKFAFSISFMILFLPTTIAT